MSFSCLAIVYLPNVISRKANSKVTYVGYFIFVSVFLCKKARVTKYIVHLSTLNQVVTWTLQRIGLITECISMSSQMCFTNRKTHQSYFDTNIPTPPFLSRFGSVSFGQTKASCWCGKTRNLCCQFKVWTSIETSNNKEISASSRH